MPVSETPPSPGGMRITFEEGAAFAAENEAWHQENARRAQQPNQPLRTRRRVPPMRFKYIMKDIRRVFDTRWPGFAFRGDVPELDFQMLYDLCYVMNYHHLDRELRLDELVRHFLVSAVRYVNQHRHFNKGYRAGNEDARRIFDEVAADFFDNVADQQVPHQPEGTVMMEYGVTGQTLMRIMKRMGAARALYLKELSRTAGPAHAASQSWTGEDNQMPPVARGLHGELLWELDRWNHFLKGQGRLAPDHVALSNLESMDAE